MREGGEQLINWEQSHLSVSSRGLDAELPPCRQGMVGHRRRLCSSQRSELWIEATSRWTHCETAKCLRKWWSAEKRRGVCSQILWIAFRLA
jgi:hypothetical protein